MITNLELQDENYEDNSLIIGDNKDVTGRQPLYVAMKLSNDEIAIGLTVQQAEDMVEKILEVLQGE